MLRGSGSVEGGSRFQIVGPLGTGSFGAVFEATDVRTGQTVAIKQLDTADAESIARFKREFRILADCHHPNLVGLKELIEEQGRWLIVMELVPGSDFLHAVLRAENDNHDGMHCDEARLRSALVGIAKGLRALHSFGVLHRDLKPSNVRVRPDGRAVLLDFGLATNIDPALQATHDLAVGTVRYMAPEQISSRVGPAADLYALGACMFEAITGRAPFEGELPLPILLEKQEQPAPRASSLVKGVPEDLDALCSALLETSPERRPTIDDVLRALGGAEALSSSAPERLSRDVFAGREIELGHLERALARARGGEPRIVLVEGESGVGKSALVAEFLRRASEATPELVALRGRCYENEQVPYKAFDGCIDELARMLKRMPRRDCAALMPPRAALLGQLFPVLRNVEAIASAPEPGAAADPTTRRLEGFRALASLLGALARTRPLVLVVDDLQWSDAESFRLLGALLEARARPPLLIVATIRPREELERDVLTQVEAVRAWGETDVVPLFGLPREQARALAAKLLEADVPAHWLATIAEESDGHPLFLRELVRYAQSFDLEARGKLTLDAALRARIEQLDSRARELLEVVALAARPFGSHVFSRALSISDFDEQARTLLAMRLLKARKGNELGCDHDRVRRTVVELIARTRLAGLHYRLAAALSSSPDTDATEQARHWDLAGESERAVAAYELAIARARETLAFTRAAQLCERALELVPSGANEQRERLCIERAHALACSGQSSAAADLYRQAADRAYGEARIRLQSRAAQQLMLSAKLTEGYVVARALLGELGIRVPTGMLGVIVRYAWYRLCIAIARPWQRSALRPEDAAKNQLLIDVIDDLLYVLMLSHPLGALMLNLRALRMQSGSGTQLARVRSWNGWLYSVERSLDVALPEFEEARALLKGAAPVDHALQAFTEGSARLAGWDWLGASECLERAQQLLQDHCPDRPWLLTQVRFHLCICWYHLAEHARLARETETWLAEARERNDFIAMALLTCMGFAATRHLRDDDPDAGLAEIDEAIARLPAQPFTFAHFGALASRSVVLLYRGGKDALAWVDAFERANAGEIFTRVRFGIDIRLIVRALATLCAAASAPEHERPPLLAAARRVANKLGRRATPYTQAYAALLTAQLELAAGARERALSCARLARELFAAHKHGNARPAAYLESLIVGSEDGRRERAAIVAEYRAQGFRDPERALAVALPLLPWFAAPAEPALREERRGP